MSTIYKKKLSKVKSSSKSGALDDIYKLSLWYFNLLYFLNNQDSVRPFRNKIDDGNEEPQHNVSKISLMILTYWNISGKMIGQSNDIRNRKGIEMLKNGKTGVFIK